MKIIGIYKITSPSGRVYIGQSQNISKRFTFYKRPVPCDRLKSQSRLYASLIKYTPKNHVFEIIEECNVDSLNERERYWQEFYDVCGKKGLNVVLVSTKEKARVVPQWLKDKISNSKKGNIPYNKGVPREKHVVEKIAMVYSPLHRKSSNLILDTTTGVYFYCLREASLAYNIPKQTLRCNLNAPNKDASKNKTNLIIT